MKLRIILTYCLLAFVLSLACAQDRKVQNRPYTDLRPFHFGIHVGAHIQDMEFLNVGPQTIVDEEGIEHESYVACDQDRVDPGFNVGVLGEFRLTENFQLRIAPAMYFGSKHIKFHNLNEEGTEKEYVTQDMKTAYVASSFDLIFAAPRFNNHRVYMMAGVCPALNLTGKSSDILMLKRVQTYVEVGVGLDQYLRFFKIRPELKFMFGLGNALDMNHANDLKVESERDCALSVSKGTAKMICLTFYFE